MVLCVWGGELLMFWAPQLEVCYCFATAPGGLLYVAADMNLNLFYTFSFFFNGFVSWGGALPMF